MAATGGRHVAAPRGEVNDGQAVTPEAEMEIGHTHILVDHTRKDGCRGSE